MLGDGRYVLFLAGLLAHSLVEGSEHGAGEAVKAEARQAFGLPADAPVVNEPG
jgi:hypothetical protein